MKKVSVVLIILIIFNLICPIFYSVKTYATTEPPETSSESEDSTEASTDSDYSSFSIDEYKSIADEGKSTINGTQKQINLGESEIGATSGLVSSFFVNVAVSVSKLISHVTNEGGLYYTESEYSADKTGIFTINSLIFGEYLIFNAKAYQKSSDLNSNITPSQITKNVDSIKESGAVVSQFINKLGLALALPFTIFAIIRTVSAKKASDLAAWKKILVRWALCIFLMIFFEYILAAVDTVADSFIETFWNMRIKLEESGYKAFEVTVEEEIANQYINTGGVTSLAYSVIFVALVIMQLLFLVKYAIRSLGIIFLFIIAPIIIVMHSFNLMLGKESNMLGDFFKDYISLVFMQPLHALFYLIFFFSMSEIAINVPVLGIILLYALYRATNIAKAMFGFEIGASLFTRK